MNQPDDDRDEREAERESAPPDEEPAAVMPRWRPASEPTCCGSGCDDCPF